MNGVVRELQNLFEVGTLGGLSDGQLLERFVERREEAVFEAIVRLHGAMVWGVCRRLLRDHHDAEDAFQTTFLVLARKAASVMIREKLGCWLYGVAYQTAMKARAMRAKRRVREVQAPDMPEPEARCRSDRDGLSDWLDEELGRLPQKYRTPIILCELEGRSHKEAAGQLGWPVGTVSSRLSRARAMLATRLARRGVSLLAGGLAAMLPRESAAAGMPAGLVGSTVRAASLVAAGGATATAGAVPAGVAALTREVLRAMRMAKIKIAVVALLAGVAVVAGIGLACWAQATGPGGRGEVRRGPSSEQKGAKGAAKAKAKASTRTPRVASASPDDGAADIDPATRELRVTFDQDMGSGMSVASSGGGPTDPLDPSARARWVGARTIVVPLKLRPNQDYELSINTERFQNFTNKMGKPAVPYPIRFRTGDDKATGASKGAAAKTEAPARTPRVAQANPDDGEEDVDPATRELRVTFDQDMDRGGFSIVGGGPTFPADPAARPRWVDARTVLVPLELEPDRDYQLSINSARFQNFRNTDGRPATPYPIRFRTGTGKGQETGNGAAKKLTQRQNREAIERLKTAIDEDYSYRDLHEVDWDAAFESAADHLAAATTPLEFAKRAAVLLAHAKDMHLWLQVRDWRVPSFDRKVAMNMNRPALERAIPGLDLEGPVAVGRLREGITYILIATWSGDTMLDAACKALGEADATKGLIVDVRPNGGGSEPLAQEFAGCFLDESKVYSKHVTRRGGAFSPVRERSVGPNPEGPKYRGKVAILMGPVNMSSCESFLLMMKQVPGCTLVGERSYGSSGNPQPVDLGNGVTAFVPSWKDLRPDGTCLEGEGVAPDVEVKAGPRHFAASDPVWRQRWRSCPKSDARPGEGRPSPPPTEVEARLRRYSRDRRRRTSGPGPGGCRVLRGPPLGPWSCARRPAERGGSIVLEPPLHR